MEIIKIIKSRLKKNQEPWINERRKICCVCPYNTKNQTKLSFKVRVVKLLSNLLNTVMFSKEIDLGQCSHEDCGGCPIFYKTKVEDEKECPENKWKSINIPNKK